MGKQTPLSTSFQLPDGREVFIETGKLATQADGSVVIRMGKTMLLATVVSSTQATTQSFFPLSVDYQEKYASVGRVPGNFFRREARLSDYEILICRLVDRAIRPLFPDGYMYETQIIINLISADKDAMPDAMAALAASAALSVSDIPWDGPISEVRVARIDGQFVVNPSRTDVARADLDIIVAASLDDVMMVEGEAKECAEADLVEAIKVGHEAIKVQCRAQLDLAKKVGEAALVKRQIELPVEDTELKNYIDSFSRSRILEVARGALDKQSRKNSFKTIEDELKVKLLEDKGEEYVEEKGGAVGEYYGKVKKDTIRKMVIKESRRLDGRKLDEVRPIWCEVDYLPTAHGSAIFNRGETQSLTSLTLGSKTDQSLVDTALDFGYSNFILHYNFPAFSVGEIKPMRGPGRREVGHANLAARSIKQVLPAEQPYTIRIVSDILESNGSSSMATVCAGSLALMDGGIKIKAPVSGIAMGLISEGTDVAILTDILGDEDALGDMDFKVTGTAKGICACQMDMKINGLPYSTLEKALLQAKEGRLHILSAMNEVLERPREDLKPHAPRVIIITIDKSYIGAVIGPGGKVIQDIQERTGTTISIEEVDNQGIVHVSSVDKAGIEQALAMINKITFTPEVGGVYDAVVKTLAPYGVFVDFHGKSGLLHISEISHSRVDRVEDVFKEGDKVKVKVIGLDQRTGKIKLSRKAVMPRPGKEEVNAEG
ncbi:MAG: polyribonucleotide nucleotidyltransferase [Saprospiraceae bacterium]|nr:polyribonucleotide nucleotidyltransferase [Saprospiraceae bacterium]